MKAKYDLRKRRKYLDMTLEQVAAKAGITPGAVRAFEVGSYRGRFETRQKIANALGISVRRLMSPKEQKAIFGDVRAVAQIQEFAEREGMSLDETLKAIRENWAELKRLGRG